MFAYYLYLWTTWGDDAAKSNRLLLPEYAEATVYQMLWMSRHGTAYIQVEKARIFMPSTRRTFHGAKRRKLLQGLEEELDCLTYRISRFLDFWASHAPIQLQGLIRDLYKELKGKQKKHITVV